MENKEVLHGQHGRSLMGGAKSTEIIRKSVRTPKETRLGKHPNSLKNLVAPWPKGVSGNPGGRPHDVAQKVARAVFEENAEQIYVAMAHSALQGSAYAFSVLAERAYGKVLATVEVSGGLRHENLSREQRIERIVELLGDTLKKDPKLRERLGVVLKGEK